MKNVTSKQIFLSLFCLFTPMCLHATAMKDTFRRYPNPVFVETGSLIGDGIQFALNAGFSEIHSIELSPHYHQICSKRFSEFSQVHLWLGDSSKILGSVIKKIDEPITFWLDGHCSFGDTAIGETFTPILQELEQVKKHPIKTHTILIDDVREFGTWRFDKITIEEIISKIYEINPNYKITFENGCIQRDILAAYIE